MEIVNIEARTYEAMISCFEAFAEKVEVTLGRHGDIRLKKWLDNQDVCQMLDITKRTLQSYRDKGLLPFCRIQHKIFYKLEDVEKLLELSSHPRKALMP